MRLAFMACFLVFLLAAGDVQGQATVTQSQDAIQPSGVNFKLGISFPAVADARQRRFTQAALKDLGVKNIRIAEDWSLREPIEGKFKWKPLDQRVKWIQRNNFQALLTLQARGPKWACTGKKSAKSCVVRNEPWRKYVTALLSRYPNVFSKIQFGNEWQTVHWYAGTAREFTDASNIVYELVKKHSPQTEFVLGGFTSASVAGLAACAGKVDQVTDENGNKLDRQEIERLCQTKKFVQVRQRIDYVLKNAKHDWLDIHLYDDAEQWPDYVNHFRTLVNKPILISEFGGPNLNYEPADQQYQAKRLGVYLKTISQLDVPEVYYFKLVEGSSNAIHKTSGLIDGKTLKPKPSYEVFKQFNGSP